MKNKLLLTLLTAVFFFSSHAIASEEKPTYNEGTVWELTLVRAKHGMVDAYLKSITGTFDAVMRGLLKEGLILDYKILLGNPANQSDFNILLMTETRNMAEQDNVRERWGKVVLAAEGDAKNRLNIATQRVDIREVLGIKLMREITLNP
ncbi:MAG: hypothetical protein NVV74_10585 [Magnetospirillum sp.]|nr:hypothetical protein [Magnetospirillum sp.]